MLRDNIKLVYVISIFLIGFLIPLPLFININNGDFFINKNYIDGIYDVYSTTVKIPNAVNIGFISLIFFMFAFFFYNIKNIFSNIIEKKKIILIILFLLNFIFFYLIYKTTFYRSISLSIIFLLFLFFILLFDNLKQYERRILIYGYVLGIFLIASAFFIDRGLTGFIISGHNFKYLFGYEIYQSLVTFPSVLSLIIVLSLLYLIVIYNFKIYDFLVVIVIITLTSVVVAYSKRTTALFFLICSIILLFMVIFFRKYNIKFLIKLFIVFLILIITSLVILIKKDFLDIQSYSARLETIDYIIKDSNNKKEDSKLNLIKNNKDGPHHDNTNITSGTSLISNGSSFSESVEEEKWGGRSSYLLELFYRFSFYGLLLFLINFAGIFYCCILTINKKLLFGCDFYSYILLLIFLQLLIECIFNSHFQTPYYLMNFLFSIFILEDLKFKYDL